MHGQQHVKKKYINMLVERHGQATGWSFRLELWYGHKQHPNVPIPSRYEIWSKSDIAPAVQA